MMRILYANESFTPQLDGVAVCAENYAKLINEKYGKSYMLVPRHEDRKVEDFDYEVLQCPSAKLTIVNQYKVCLPMKPKLRSKIETMPLDLVHSHSPFITGILSMKIAKQKGIPCISTFHSKYKDDVNQRMKMNVELPGEMVAKYVASFYDKCDYVWTLNEGTARTLKEYGYKGNITIMPNGCDMPITDRDEKIRKDLAIKYDVNDTYPILLFVGRLTKLKNIDLTIKALAALKRRGKNFSMLFAGSGEDEKELKEMSNSLGLADNVKFIGKVMDRKQLRDIYSSCDLFVFPSVYDNAPLVVREAAACGVPSLLIRGSNSAEGVVDGENGILADEKIEDVSLALSDALSLDLKLIGKAARRTMYISWDDVVAKAADEYKRILIDYHQKNENNRKIKVSLYDIDLIKDFDFKIIRKMKEMYRNARSRA